VKNQSRQPLFLLKIVIFQLNLVSIAQNKANDAKEKEEIKILLKPNEKLEPIKVSDSCLILLRD